MKTTPPSTALKHIYHAVYLQWLLGAFLAFVVPAVSHDGDKFLDVTPRSGGLLIFTGINIYCYVRRYEKALAEHALFAPKVA